MKRIINPFADPNNNRPMTIKEIDSIIQMSHLNNILKSNSFKNIKK